MSVLGDLTVNIVGGLMATALLYLLGRVFSSKQRTEHSPLNRRAFGISLSFPEIDAPNPAGPVFARRLLPFLGLALLVASLEVALDAFSSPLGVPSPFMSFPKGSTSKEGFFYSESRQATESAKFEADELVRRAQDNAEQILHRAAADLDSSERRLPPSIAETRQRLAAEEAARVLESAHKQAELLVVERKADAARLRSTADSLILRSHDWGLADASLLRSFLGWCIRALLLLGITGLARRAWFLSVPGKSALFTCLLLAFVVSLVDVIAVGMINPLVFGIPALVCAAAISAAIKPFGFGENTLAALSLLYQRFAHVLAILVLQGVAVALGAGIGFVVAGKNGLESWMPVWLGAHIGYEYGGAIAVVALTSVLSGTDSRILQNSD